MKTTIKIHEMGLRLIRKCGLMGLIAASVVTAPAQTTVEDKLAALEARIQQLETELAAKGVPASVRQVNDTSPAAFIRPAVLTTSSPVAMQPIAALDPAAPQDAAPATPPAPTLEDKMKDLDFDALGFFKGTKMSALLDVYYLYDFNKPEPPFLPFRNFDQNAKSITLNLLELNLTKAVSKETPIGYNFTFAVGPTADLVSGSDPMAAVAKAHTTSASATATNFLQYYISARAPLGNGLVFDFGKFVTPIGAEVIESMSNWNYSRSDLFTLAIPYYHFGARATYASSKATVAFYLVNGWNNVIDNNGGKTYGVNLILTPSSKFSLAQTYMAGPEQSGSNTNFRQLYDMVMTITGKKVSFMTNFDYGHEDGAAPDGSSVHWLGVAGYLKFQLAPKWAMIPRFEWFNDADGFETGTVQQMKEFTLTSEIPFGDHLVSRMEYRRDWSPAGIFARGPADFGKSHDTISGAFMMKF